VVVTSWIPDGTPACVNSRTRPRTRDGSVLAHKAFAARAFCRGAKVWSTTGTPTRVGESRGLNQADGAAAWLLLSIESPREVEFVFELQDQAGYRVNAPELPARHRHGDGLEQATENARGALTLYIRGLRRGRQAARGRDRPLQTPAGERRDWVPARVDLFWRSGVASLCE
jgi:predicted RNase H-like HicB family nuclease